MKMVRIYKTDEWNVCIDQGFLYLTRFLFSLFFYPGITDFKLKLEINSDETTITQQLAEYSVFNIHKQLETFTGISWKNGDRMKITITAFDIMGTTKRDNIILYKDTTPPNITNLWLTKEDELGVAVFGFTDFNEMT